MCVFVCVLWLKSLYICMRLLNTIVWSECCWEVLKCWSDWEYYSTDYELLNAVGIYMRYLLPNIHVRHEDFGIFCYIFESKMNCVTIDSSELSSGNTESTVEINNQVMLVSDVGKQPVTCVWRLQGGSVASWLSGNYVVECEGILSFKEKWGSFELCVDECSHLINGTRILLKPCVMFMEMIATGNYDFNLEYIFRSSLMGCQIANRDIDTSYDMRNYNSILKDKAFGCMNEIVNDELLEGIVSIVKDRPVCIHALGAVDKDNGSSIRCITDASRPVKVSINNFMEDIVDPFCYIAVKDVAKEMTQDCVMTVLDIKGAYRSIPVCGEQRTLQGFRWVINDKEEFLVNNSLAFGLRSAPFIFTQYTEFIVRCMKSRGYDRVYGYLDDFLIMEKDVPTCWKTLYVLMGLLRRFGFYINYKKLISPTKCIRYLGINLSSVDMKLYLPDDKLLNLQNLIEEFLLLKRCTKKQLQSLVGVLSHCSTIIRGGRTFSRRAINLINTVEGQNDKLVLDANFVDDLKWWKNFAVMFNGSATVIDIRFDNCLTMYADASMLGFGACYRNDWFYGTWCNEIVPEFEFRNHFEKGPGHILRCSAERELWPILMACVRWGSGWRNKAIHVFTDNVAVEIMLRTGRSKNRYCMQWLREIFWCSFVYNFEVFPHRISSVQNVFCDALSRVVGKKARSVAFRYAHTREFCCLSGRYSCVTFD